MNVNIHPNKVLEISLTAIYGLGRSLSKKICLECGIDPNRSAQSLTAEEQSALRQVISNHEIEGDLKRKRAANIRRLIDIGTYRGRRHRAKLPVRGQRTASNAKSVRRSKSL